MARNVEDLQLIQLGVSLSDVRGNTVAGGGTWQFNFRFDVLSDRHGGRRVPSGIQVLMVAGFDFPRLRKHGIPHGLFFNELEANGLLRNPKVRWVTYHGLHDFGYLFKYLTRVPDKKGLRNDREFEEVLQTYFPKRSDLKVLALTDANLPTYGGLQNLADCTQCVRHGTNNHAGLDAALIRYVFIKLSQGMNFKRDCNKKWRPLRYAAILQLPTQHQEGDALRNSM